MGPPEAVVLLTEGMEQTNAGTDELITSSSGTASIVYASVGCEILSATLRAFWDALLSLQFPTRAAGNIGMLSNLASVIHRNERLLCKQFWSGWEDFFQSGGEDGGMVDGEDEKLNNDKPI